MHAAGCIRTVQVHLRAYLPLVAVGLCTALRLQAQLQGGIKHVAYAGL